LPNNKNTGWNAFMAVVWVILCAFLINFTLSPWVEETLVIDKAILSGARGDQRDWILQNSGVVVWTGRAQATFIEDAAINESNWAIIKYQKLVLLPWKINIECHIHSIRENVSRSPAISKQQEVNVLI
jgi:hypothetical protein